MSLFHVPGLSDAAGPNPLVTSFPAVNTFTIASFTMPGKWTLLSATKVFGWQIQQGVALNGATLNPVGDPPVTAKFRGEMWEPAQFALFKEIRKQILSTAVFTMGGGLLTAAMGIDHPELNAMGVSAVVMKEMEPAIQEDGGLWVAHVDFLQYRRPSPALPKPKVTIPPISPPVPTPRNALEIKADQLNAEILSQKGLLLK
jgi:hypothetical protein